MRTLPKTSDTIYALTYSPDGSVLASGHGYPPLEEVDHMRGRGVVRCWQASTGRLLRTLSGHTQNVMGVAFSPDGQTLASVSGSSIAVPQAASKPGELILRSAKTGKLVRTVSRPWRAAHGCRLSSRRNADRNLELGPNDQALGRVDRRLRQSLRGHQDWVLHVEFSPDGRRIATGGADGAIKVWETTSNQEPFTLRGHKQNVTCVAFSPDGRRLASTSSDQTVKIWDATANPEVITWRGGVGPIARIAFFPDGHRLLVAGNLEDQPGRVHPRLTIVDTSQGMREDTLEPANDPGSRPPDRRHCRQPRRPDCRRGIPERPRRSLDGPCNQSCFRYDEPTSRFQGVAFSPDGRKLATAGQINARLENGESGPNDTDAQRPSDCLRPGSGAILWRRAG